MFALRSCCQSAMGHGSHGLAHGKSHGGAGGHQFYPVFVCPCVSTSWRDGTSRACRVPCVNFGMLGRSVDGTGRSRVLGVQPAARADVIIRDSMDHLNFSMPQRPQSSNCGQALPALPFTTSEITISLPPPKPLAEHGSACGRRQDAGVPAARGCARGVRVGDHV